MNLPLWWKECLCFNENVAVAYREWQSTEEQKRLLYEIPKYEKRLVLLLLRGGFQTFFTLWEYSNWWREKRESESNSQQSSLSSAQPFDVGQLTADVMFRLLKWPKRDFLYSWFFIYTSLLRWRQEKQLDALIRWLATLQTEFISHQADTFIKSHHPIDTIVKGISISSHFTKRVWSTKKYPNN